MKNLLRYILLFLGAMSLFSVANVYAWKWCVAGRVYHAPHLLGLSVGYLEPGQWVRGDVRVVAALDTTQSLKQGDQILQGWSVPRLWMLWWAFFAASVIASAILSAWLGRVTQKKGMVITESWLTSRA